MPIYEYECTECGHRTELLQRFGDPPLAACPQCEGTVRKLFSAPAVQFKGSGWYVTDYAGKGKSQDASSATSDKGSAETGSSDKGSSDKRSGGGKKESKPAAEGASAKSGAGGD